MQAARAKFLQQWSSPQLPNLPLIACVDDDASVREALEGLLLSIGYDAQTYASAEDFLLRADLGEVSCLITDMKLGGMSGLQLQKQLNASGCVVPTIVISAFDDDQMQQRLLAAGALGFLRKPIHEAELLSLIKKALSLPRPGMPMATPAPKNKPRGNA